MSAFSIGRWSGSCRAYYSETQTQALRPKPIVPPSSIDLLQQENIRLAGAEPSGALKPSKNGPGTLRAEYRSRLAQIGEEQIDHAFDAPVPGIGTLAAPVFDHTGNIRLVIALIGSSGHFDRSVQGRNAQQLLAATRRLSWRLGWVDHH